MTLIKIILFILITWIVGLFVFFNNQNIAVDLIIKQIPDLHLGLLVLLAGIIGFIIGASWMWLSMVKYKFKASQLTSQKTKIQKELDGIKTTPTLICSLPSQHF